MTFDSIRRLIFPMQMLSTFLTDWEDHNMTFRPSMINQSYIFIISVKLVLGLLIFKARSQCSSCSSYTFCRFHLRSSWCNLGDPIGLGCFFSRLILSKFSRVASGRYCPVLLKDSLFIIYLEVLSLFIPHYSN